MSIKDYILKVDNREKRPLTFPTHLVVAGRTGPETVRLHQQSATLSAGDYCLSGFENRVLIERKGSIMEIASNVMGSDRPRFLKALDKLAAACSHPHVLVEGIPSELLRESKRVPNPHHAISLFQKFLFERNIQLIFLPSGTILNRQMVGSWAAHLLITGARGESDGISKTQQVVPVELAGQPG